MRTTVSTILMFANLPRSSGFEQLCYLGVAYVRTYVNGILLGSSSKELYYNLHTGIRC